MCAKGNICTEVWSTNYTSYQVFKKTVGGTTTYSAQVWNPYDKEITVQFANKNGNLGSVKVKAHALVSVDPTKTITAAQGQDYVEYENRDKTITIPGVVAAEDYDTNFGCEPTTGDREGGYIGWIDDGDSLVYNINVTEEADYVLDYRVQCTDKNKNSAIKLKTDNDEDYIETTMLDNSTTEWKNVKSTNTVHLKKGTYQMKLLLVDGGFNFNYVKIYKAGTKPPVAPTDDLTKADLSAYPEIDLSNAEVIDVSSEANYNCKGSNIIDGDYNKRWESKAEDPQYLTIDLKKVEKIGGIKIYWEAAYAKDYRVEISTDNTTWSTAFIQTNGKGGEGNGDDRRDNRLESISFNRAVEGRYVRIYCETRATGYGDSIYEIRLFGEGEEQKEQPTTKPAETTTQEETTAKSEESTTKPVETTAKQDHNEQSTFVSGKYIYQAEENSTKVKIIGATKKSIRKIKIPKIVRYNGKKYVVTTIGANAFRNYKKLRYVKIGSGIVKIEKRAFYKCIKLKKIVITSKVLKKVDKKAFARISRKASIKVPKRKRKLYKKILSRAKAKSVKIK